jgi:hypothetical protein
MDDIWDDAMATHDNVVASVKASQLERDAKLMVAAGLPVYRGVVYSHAMTGGAAVVCECCGDSIGPRLEAYGDGWSVLRNGQRYVCRWCGLDLMRGELPVYGCECCGSSMHDVSRCPHKRVTG